MHGVSSTLNPVFLWTSSFDPSEDSTDQWSESSDLVHHAPSSRGAFDPEAAYVLGVDGGSTTTKAAFVNTRTIEVIAHALGSWAE